MIRVLTWITLAGAILAAAGCGGTRSSVGTTTSGVAGVSTATTRSGCATVQGAAGATRSRIRADLSRTAASTSVPQLRRRLDRLAGDVRTSRAELHGTAVASGPLRSQVQRLRDGLDGLQAGLDRVRADVRAGKLVQALADLPQHSASVVADATHRIGSICGRDH